MVAFSGGLPPRSHLLSAGGGIQMSGQPDRGGISKHPPPPPPKKPPFARTLTSIKNGNSLYNPTDFPTVFPDSQHFYANVKDSAAINID